MWVHYGKLESGLARSGDEDSQKPNEVESLGNRQFVSRTFPQEVKQENLCQKFSSMAYAFKFLIELPNALVLNIAMTQHY